MKISRWRKRWVSTVSNCLPSTRCSDVCHCQLGSRRIFWARDWSGSSHGLVNRRSKDTAGGHSPRLPRQQRAFYLWATQSTQETSETQQAFEIILEGPSPEASALPGSTFLTWILAEKSWIWTRAAEDKERHLYSPHLHMQPQLALSWALWESAVVLSNAFP